MPVAPAQPSAALGNGRVTISWRSPKNNGTPGAARVFKAARTCQVAGGLHSGKPYTFNVAVTTWPSSTCWLKPAKQTSDGADV